MCKTKSYRGGSVPVRNFAKVDRHLWRNVALAAAVAAGVGMGATAANAAAALWISAPDWSYSAAAAASPSGSIYFWALSVGPGTYTWAWAYSHNALGSADAYAEASANSLGGVCAAQASGFADPAADVGIDTTPLNGFDTSSYPTSGKPSSDPLSSAYTVTDTGITFTSGSAGYNSPGAGDAIEAFLYSGNSSASYASLETALGASSSSGSSSAGDVTSISTLETDLGLTPLDAAVSDPGNLSSLAFTENYSSSMTLDNVILVGMSDAASAPVPSALSLSMLGVLGLGSLALARRKHLRRSELS